MSRSGRASRRKGDRPRKLKGNERPAQRKDKLRPKKTSGDQDRAFGAYMLGLLNEPRAKPRLVASTDKPRRAIDWDDPRMMHMAAEAQPDYEPPYPKGPLGEE